MARAIVYTEFGGPEVLREIELPDPAPGDGQVLVRVEAAGVNPIDAKLRSGLRKSSPPSADKPRRVGVDAAGVVLAVGDGVDGLRVGEPVVLAGAFGSYADVVVAAAEKVVPRPAGVTPAQGAAVGTPVGTAYQALRSLAVGAGDMLLVHGGSGAVGQAAIQFARLAGATVLATTSPGRADRVRALGAVPVEYGEGLAARVRDAAPDGVTVILDAAGTDEALDTSVELLTERHRIATIVRGADAAGYGIRGFGGGSPEPLSAQQETWRREAIPVALALLATGGFEIELGPQLPLAEAVEAHRLLAAGAAGKITLAP